ncbi:MAG: FAD-dependent oxidoreductase [Clostridiales bacterium]|jgi:hypothetical protein|nr:FAD-dependent oxidoreductase [Clostridiales bacterium]
MTIYEAARQIPMAEKADVVVCGGGPAGFIAAVAASRMGARTVLLERYGFLGGMATVSMVSPISAFNKNGKRVIHSIPWEYIKELEKLGGAITNYPSGNIHFDPETYKLLAARFVRRSNAALYLHSLVAGCILEDGDAGQITHLIFESKSGRQAIEAGYFIDCTGDADLAHYAGFQCESGDMAAGELQPMTLWFRLGGVDANRLANMHMREENTKYSNTRIRDILRSLDPSEQVPNFGGPWCTTTLREGEASINMTRSLGDGTNVLSLTKAEVALREDAHRLIALLKRHVPEFKNCYLIDTGAAAGIRETRRIKGQYKMTARDIAAPQDYPDTIAKGAHPIDIHLPNGHQQYTKFLDKAYNIPYRCMLPVGAKNLIVAGRCVSATREAFASIRVQATCMALGQAAGTAAALCARTKTSVGALDIQSLREQLRMADAII